MFHGQILITAGLQNVLIFFKITFEPIFSAITDTVPLISNYVASSVIIPEVGSAIFLGVRFR